MPDFWNINIPPITKGDPSLPLYDQEQAVPFHLEVQDQVRIHTEEMRHEVVPTRVFYDEWNKMYIYADLKTTPIQIYFVEDLPHYPMLGSVLFAWIDTCKQLLGEDAEELYDVVDFCIHKAPKDVFKFSLLLCNKAIKRMTLIRFKVTRSQFEEIYGGTPEPLAYHLSDQNVDFIGNILHNKVYDEMAITSQQKVPVPPLYIPIGTIGGFTHTLPNVAEIVPKLHQHLYIGEIDYDYCGLTCTEMGQYVVLLQSRITVWISPFLSCKVDVQYIITLDENGMNSKWILAGPLDAAVNFDETTLGQPYLYSPMIAEGCILVCAQHRKYRNIRPAIDIFRSINILPPHTWYEIPIGAEQWDGGVRADLFYPHYKLSGAHRGYVTEWDALGGSLDPSYRETVWMRANMQTLSANAQSLPALRAAWHRISFLHHSFEEQALTRLALWDVSATTFYEKHIIRFSIDPLVFYSQTPVATTIPTAHITISGVLPGETKTFTYHAVNSSYTMKICNISITPSGTLPAGLTVSVSGLPTELLPGLAATKSFSITVAYSPPAGTKPEVNLTIPLEVEYFLLLHLPV